MVIWTVQCASCPCSLFSSEKKKKKKREFVFLFLFCGNKRDKIIKILGGQCVGAEGAQGVELSFPLSRKPLQPPGNPVPALSLTRDKGYGGLKPEQTQLLLKFA